MNKKHNVRFIAESAVIAALYAVLTYISAMLNLAYGPVQLRFSEALTVLPLFTPAAIPGLTVGCLISNLGSSLGIYDWIFGTLATFSGSILTRYLKDIKVKGLPVLSIIMPVISNAAIVGTEVGLLTKTGAGLAAISVGISELIICCGLGIPVYCYLCKSRIFK